MNNVSANMADVSNEPEPDDHGQGFYVSWLYKVSPTDAIGFAKMVWSLLQQIAMRKSLKKLPESYRKQCNLGATQLLVGQPWAFLRD